LTIPTSRSPALVHDWLTGMRGGERVLEALLKLLPDAPIYTLFHFEGSVSPSIEQRDIHTSGLQRLPGIRGNYRRFLPLFPRAVESFDLDAHDLIVSTSHCVAKGAIPPPGSFHVCYCHTPMRYAWDQQRAYFPESGSPIGRLRDWMLSRLRQWDVRTADRVDLYVANSHFVADRIRHYYKRDSIVVHPPVDVDFYTPGSASDDKPYCLMVSALAPYKRVDLAIEACEKAGVELRIVGTGPEQPRLERLAGPGTRFLGRVSGEELRELFRGSLCLLQPGIEDFGITSVEALACGRPVVALGIGGILDIVESGVHGVLYDVPEDASALAAAIDNCARIGLNETSLRKQAEQFSTRLFQDRMASVFEEHLPNHRRGS